jgi:hypothetical protein
MTACVVDCTIQKGCCDAPKTKRRRHKDAIDRPYVRVVDCVEAVARDQSTGEHMSKAGPWLDTTPPDWFIPGQSDQAPWRVESDDLLAQQFLSRIPRGRALFPVIEDMELTPAVAGRCIRSEHRLDGLPSGFACRHHAYPSVAHSHPRYGQIRTARFRFSSNRPSYWRRLVGSLLTDLVLHQAKPQAIQNRGGSERIRADLLRSRIWAFVLRNIDIERAGLDSDFRMAERRCPWSSSPGRVRFVG